ncbi:MAG: DUF4127 family protein [Candidatus Gastranaerophilaceae bacterium]|jgi:hypothetical protein
MRISNNNINEEEKLYWDKYGELIFKYSFLTHKTIISHDFEDVQTLEKLKSSIPTEILTDYIDTRKRNLNINKQYIDWIKEGFFEYFVYSQDDTAKYGLNVQEKDLLLELIEKNNLQTNASIKTGADEIPTCLTVRGINDFYKQAISIFPVFFNESSKNIISRYEDVTIEHSADGQISLCGCKIAKNEATADILLILNTPKATQNDHAMKIYTECEDEIQIQKIINLIKNTSKPFILADVKFANGADNRLVQTLLSIDTNLWSIDYKSTSVNGVGCKGEAPTQQPLPLLGEGAGGGVNNTLNSFYGFAAWNTTGNTFGSAISMAVSRLIAEKTQGFNTKCFKNLLFVRFADDWAYQTISRQKIRSITSNADEELLYEELKPYLETLCKKLSVDCDKIKLSFPWNRTFEVEIEF